MPELVLFGSSVSTPIMNGLNVGYIIKRGNSYSQCLKVLGWRCGIKVSWWSWFFTICLLSLAALILDSSTNMSLLWAWTSLKAKPVANLFKWHPSTGFSHWCFMKKLKEGKVTSNTLLLIKFGIMVSLSESWWATLIFKSLTL